MTREEAQRYIAKLTYEEKKKLNDLLKGLSPRCSHNALKLS